MYDVRNIGPNIRVNSKKLINLWNQKDFSENQSQAEQSLSSADGHHFLEQQFQVSENKPL